MPVALDLTASFHTQRTVCALTKKFWPDHQKMLLGREPAIESPISVAATWILSLLVNSFFLFPGLVRSSNAGFMVGVFVAMQLIEDLAVAPVTENGGPMPV